jgi:hypothetical protein
LRWRQSAQYFRTDVAAFVTRYDGQQEIGAQVIAEELQLPTQDSQTSDLLALPPLAEVERAHEPTRIKQAVEASKSREQEERLENLANEFAKDTRPINELDLPLRPEDAKTAQLREQKRFKQTAERMTAELQRERERAEALASELARVRREVEAAAAVDDEAVQQKQTAEGAIADLQQLLQQEQKKTAALTQEVGAARQAMTANAEQQRRALDEAQARAAATRE